jgi:capsular polysaccharide biosynthesis protein
MFLLLEEYKVLQNDLFLFLKGFRVLVLGIIVIKKIFDKYNKQISDINPVPLHLPIIGNIIDDLNHDTSTFLS